MKYELNRKKDYNIGYGWMWGTGQVFNCYLRLPVLSLTEGKIIIRIFRVLQN